MLVVVMVVVVVVAEVLVVVVVVVVVVVAVVIGPVVVVYIKCHVIFLLTFPSMRRSHKTMQTAPPETPPTLSGYVHQVSAIRTYPDTRAILFLKLKCTSYAYRKTSV